MKNNNTEAEATAAARKVAEVARSIALALELLECEEAAWPCAPAGPDGWMVEFSRSAPDTMVATINDDEDITLDGDLLARAEALERDGGTDGGEDGGN